MTNKIAFLILYLYSSLSIFVIVAEADIASSILIVRRRYYLLEGTRDFSGRDRSTLQHINKKVQQVAHFCFHNAYILYVSDI